MCQNLNQQNTRLRTATVKIEIQLSGDDPVQTKTFEHSFVHIECLPHFLEPRVQSALTELIAHHI